MIDAWLSASEMIASSSPRSVSNRPPLASKHERTITSPQAAHIRTNGKEVVNFCANNYLGLSSHPRVIAAARQALEDRGYGLSSVRFICGTQDKHKELEASVSKFLGTEDTILYGSCFDANGGLFETLLGEDDANTDLACVYMRTPRISHRGGRNPVTRGRGLR